MSGVPNLKAINTIMRTFILLMMLIASLMSHAAVQENKVAIPPIKWLPIYGFIDKHSKAFLDENSTEVHIDGKNKVVSQTILISSNYSTSQIEIEGKLVNVKSVARYIMVECNSKMGVTLVDYYFAVSMPTREDTPIAVLKHQVTNESAKQLAEDSLTYRTFCPEYI